VHGTATDRVLRLYEAIRPYQPPRVALERAVLFTESFKETEGQPLVLRWAKALKHFADKAPVSIFDDELIVGRPNTWLGRWAIVYPELDGSTMPSGVQMFRDLKGKAGEVLVTDEDKKVIDAFMISPWLMILQVAPDGWDLPHFVPGQFVSLGLFGSSPRCAFAEPEGPAPSPDKLIRRAYCMSSSAANRKFIEFYVHLVPHGALTPRLFNLKIGDRIWLGDTVTGMFTFGDVRQEANVVLIATGSGLAPFVSMLSTHLKFAAQRRVAVLHGARHSWDLAYRSILMNMQNLRDNFIYLPVISRTKQEPVPWSGAVGYLEFAPDARKHPCVSLRQSRHDRGDGSHTGARGIWRTHTREARTDSYRALLA
jgi:ferredoxin/flavodoxin---NADP+ reductase